MKKVLLVLVSVVMLFAQSSVDNGYKSWAIGGGLSIAIPDDDWYNGHYDGNYSYDGYYYYSDGYFDFYSLNGAGIGAEISSVFRFKIGKGGWIQYAPSVSWWGRWDSWNTGIHNNSVAISDWKLSFNIADVRYAPPVPDDFLLKPYVGFGLFNFSLYHYKEEIGGGIIGGDHYGNEYYRNGYYNSDTDYSLMQSIFIGAEFDTGKSLWPYFEFKGSNGNVGDFLVTVGFTVQHNK